MCMNVCINMYVCTHILVCMSIICLWNYPYLGTYEFVTWSRDHVVTGSRVHVFMGPRVHVVTVCICLCACACISFIMNLCTRMHVRMCESKSCKYTWKTKSNTWTCVYICMEVQRNSKKKLKSTSSITEIALVGPGIWVRMYWIGVFCGLVSSVDWCFLWIGVFCGLVSSVDWCFLWIGVFCGLVSSVDWCLLWG